MRIYIHRASKESTSSGEEGKKLFLSVFFFKDKIDTVNRLIITGRGERGRKRHSIKLAEEKYESYKHAHTEMQCVLTTSKLLFYKAATR